MATSAVPSMTGSRFLKYKPAEKAVQKDVVDNLRALGFFVITTSQAKQSHVTPGTPDVYCAHSKFGVQLWIEMKAPHRRNQRNGGVTDDQLMWQLRARAAGVDVIVAYGWTDVANELRKRGVPVPI
jgi:hypothetical protein